MNYSEDENKQNYYPSEKETEAFNGIYKTLLTAKVDEIDLSNTTYNASKLNYLLENKGLKRTDFNSNGWDYDFTIYFENENDLENITMISGTGYTCELKLIYGSKYEWGIDEN